MMTLNPSRRSQNKSVKNSTAIKKNKRALNIDDYKSLTRTQNKSAKNSAAIQR